MEEETDPVSLSYSLLSTSQHSWLRLMVDVNATDYLLEAILSGLLQVGGSYSLVA